MQRVQSVTLPGWTSIAYAKPIPDSNAFDQVCTLYEKFILPKAPYLFGTLIFFYLPEDMDIPFSYDTKYGHVSDKEIAASIGLSGYIKAGRFSPDKKTSAFIEELKHIGFFRIIKGTRPFHAKVLCISNKMGLLSSLSQSSSILSNAGFFTMDMFDLGSPYDIIGRPVGLNVKDGIVYNPPLFDREALIVKKDGSVRIERPALSDVRIEICGHIFIPGNDCKLFERPKKRWADGMGINLAIIGNKVVAVCEKKKMIIPSAGFILQIDKDHYEKLHLKAGSTVEYRGFEDVLFGIQAGNSIIKDGIPTKGFISYFSNIRDPFALPIPPSLYPLDYEKARAPRMAIGSDANNDPVLIWAEGPGKFDNLKDSTKGYFSCGASLSEMTVICKELGLLNAVNLDGGGSAQILIDGKRSLLISDRHKEDNSEYERAIPIGLSIQ